MHPLRALAAIMYAPKGAVLLANEIDRTMIHGRMLGLTENQIRECINRELVSSRYSPDPVRWDEIRRDMIAVAMGQP